jgi:hypothetical protein
VSSDNASAICFETWLGLDEKIRGEVKTIKPSLIEEIKQDIKSTLQDNVRMVVREIEDQKTRAMNLIFFNVPESEDKCETREILFTRIACPHKIL